MIGNTPENNRVSKETIARQMLTRARPKQASDGLFCWTSIEPLAISRWPLAISNQQQRKR